MTGPVKHLVLTLFVAWTPYAALAVVLSSSKLQACLNDGSEQLQCDKKVVIEVTLEHGQGKTEGAQFTVTEASEGTNNRELQKPWRVTWSKSPAFWRYPLRYVQEVNNRPRETVIKTSWGKCRDAPLNGGEMTCGFAYLGGKPVTDSEGKCCGCNAGSALGGNPSRGNLQCNWWDPGSLSEETAHCLDFDELWLTTLEIDPPQIFYDITVGLARPDDPSASWNNVTYSETSFKLSQQQPASASADGALLAQLVGDFATAVVPYNFESRYLLVPSMPAGHPRVDPNNPLRSAMLLDKSLFDLSGKACDKVGVSYAAFKWQANMCEKRIGSCLAGQPDDYFREDSQRLSTGQPSRYMVAGYCNGSAAWVKGPDPQRFLACPLLQRQTSLLRLEVRADEAMFVTNVATGKIVSATAPPFEALKGGGQVTIVIVSTGRVTAEFTVGMMQCTDGMSTGPALKITLQPYQVSQQSIKLDVASTSANRHTCTATLNDATGKVLDTKLVEVNVTATQITQGAQVGVNRPEGDDIGEAQGVGSCAVKCPSFFDVACFVVTGCWSKLGTLFGLIIGALLLCCCCIGAAKKGLWCKLCSCIFKASTELNGGLANALSAVFTLGPPKVKAQPASLHSAGQHIPPPPAVISQAAPFPPAFAGIYHPNGYLMPMGGPVAAGALPQYACGPPAGTLYAAATAHPAGYGCNPIQASAYGQPPSCYEQSGKPVGLVQEDVCSEPASSDDQASYDSWPQAGGSSFAAAQPQEFQQPAFSPAPVAGACAGAGGATLSKAVARPAAADRSQPHAPPPAKLGTPQADGAPQVQGSKASVPLGKGRTRARASSVRSTPAAKGPPKSAPAAVKAPNGRPPSSERPAGPLARTSPLPGKGSLPPPPPAQPAVSAGHSKTRAGVTEVVKAAPVTKAAPAIKATAAAVTRP